MTILHLGNLALPLKEGEIVFYEDKGFKVISPGKVFSSIIRLNKNNPEGILGNPVKVRNTALKRLYTVIGEEEDIIVFSPTFKEIESLIGFIGKQITLKDDSIIL